MKNKIWGILLILCLLGISSTYSAAFAANLKERFKARLPIIKVLKQKHIVGENNKGFLEFITNKKEKKDVVDAENSDRGKVYASIAKREGTTMEVVGVHRAAQIEKKADPGEWLQDARGRWYQKR
ncbi:MAG: DUF1318 domain-containing protein [Deltaproteobacteria bacterium]|nr:DUF1318 domain-containing protein [Deltaproteobacteria bacterium]